MVIPQRIAYEDIRFHLHTEKKSVTISPSLQGGDKVMITLASEDQWLVPDVVNSAVTLERLSFLIGIYIL